MTVENNLTLIASTGDPAGASPELIPSLLNKLNKEEKIIFVGPEAVRKELCPGLKLTTDPRQEEESCWFTAGNIKTKQICSGNIDANSGRAAYTALKTALELIEKGNFNNLLTLPLSKKAVQKAGHPGFTGHTEYLEDFAGRKGLMSFFGNNFNCSLLTRHLPLRKVANKITTRSVIEKIKICKRYFSNLNNDSPRFALLGLNPHAGEGGSLGEEEIEVLQPAVKQLKSNGINITGPHPADSFLPIQGQTTDMIFSCYHDQGLTPFKQQHFFTGVHSTLGLGFNRVSPVHGTATGIAGTGRIDPRSAINCLDWLRRQQPNGS
ncbi:MAG: PdxA family dehydrogenase [bacterium]